MRRWIEAADRIGSTRSTTAKVASVAAYLRTLDADELPEAVVFLSGRPFPEADPRTTGLGWAAIGRVAEDVAGPQAGGLGAAYDRSSDLGTAVGDLFRDAGHEGSDPPSLVEVGDAFAAIADARGPVAKATILRPLLERSDPDVARSIAKILSGELRIGLREGHLEAGIAAAYGRDVAAVQWAGMLTGDIGHTAELARDDRLDAADLTLLRPLKVMLASPVADEGEALQRLAPPVWVEDKYDGIRAQLHRLGDEVRLFSRDLHDVSGQFPEVGEAARSLDWDGILDGELLAWKDGGALPFLQLQGRLGRKAPSPAIMEQVPVIYVAFDVLAIGPRGGRIEPLVRLPLRDRRSQLDLLGLQERAGFGLAALSQAPDEAALARLFEAAQERGNEGLMVKDPDSTYAPGRRGYAWLKLKKALTTLDCVVVGVEVGHGRRHGVLSDYTFAVRDDRPGTPDGRLVTIGKAYSGLTDVEIADMTRWFEAHTLAQHGRYRVVEPAVVVEIAFDVIHRSTRHAAGFAMRFPRIVRIRDDKTAGDVDTLSTVESLYEALQQGGRYRVLTGGR